MLTRMPFVGPRVPEQLEDWFGNDAPVHVEIGCGYGEWVIKQAALWPELNFVAVELNRKRVLATLRHVVESELENVRVVSCDASLCFEQFIPDASLAAVHLNFPDPWPKARQQKNRLVQPPFMSLVSEKLVVDGRWHSVTDDHDLNEHMLEVLLQEGNLVPDLPSPHFTSRVPDYLQGSVFGSLWEELGRDKYYMSWRRARG
jgi:tRNA (guanine-N7-)-methyltransferase